LPIDEPGDGVIGDGIGDLLGGLRAVGPEPMRRPVERAEEGAGGDRRVGRAQEPPADAVRHQRADTALVAIALGDDARAQRRRQRVDLEMRRRSVDLVEQAQDVCGGEPAEPVGERPGIAPRRRERRQHPLERLVLAEEQQFILAAEVVIQVAGRQVGGGGDVAHPGRGEAAGAEHLRRGAHDRDAAGIGPFRTAVRRVNHRSILLRIGAAIAA
jgi:hypothetical protein